MYRIKLPNGTVLEFDSLDALTVDIHANVVEAEALIFHQRANQWLPIHVHPAWKQALATPRKTPAAETAAPASGTSATAAAKPAARPVTRIGAPPKPGAPRPAVAAKAPVAPVAAAKARPDVSVEHLDEELELLGIDELELPGQESAAVAVLARPAKESAVAAFSVPTGPTPLDADLPDDAEMLELLPVNAAPEPAPIVEPTSAPVSSMALPPSVASAETLVARTDLLVDPVDESMALADASESAEATTSAATASISEISGDLASEIIAASGPEAMEEAPDPSFADTAAPIAANTDETLELMTADTIVAERTDDHVEATADIPPADETAELPAPRITSARPNRMVWYAGGAVAAAGVLVMLALRTGDADATRTPPTEDAKSANSGVPGAPLKPPPVLDLPAEPVREAEAGGRIAAPADAAPATAAATASAERNSVKEKAVKTLDAAPKTIATAVAKKPADEEVVLAPVDLQAMTAADPITVKFDVAPNVLAARYTAAQDAAWGDLTARLRVAGFDNLFGPSRTAPAGAPTARAAIAAARSHIAQWRTRASVIDKAYRDSTSALISAGAWSAAEQREWEGRARRPESGESALQANAILAAADRLYGILAANSSAYEVVTDGLRFSDSGAQRQYWDARRTLVAAIGAAGAAEAKTPLAAILKAIGTTRPPEGLNAS